MTTDTRSPRRGAGVIRIQRKRAKGWRIPEGAVYVGRPSLFGNPWSLDDARIRGVSGWREQAEWCVRMYRAELEHMGLLGDWGGIVSEARWEAMHARVDQLCGPFDAGKPPSIRPLFRELLKDATALACWCPLDQPCHSDVLIELLEGDVAWRDQHGGER
jgi:hypothetical protein